MLAVGSKKQGGDASNGSNPKWVGLIKAARQVVIELQNSPSLPYRESDTIMLPR